MNDEARTHDKWVRLLVGTLLLALLGLPALVQRLGPANAAPAAASSDAVDNAQSMGHLAGTAPAGLTALGATGSPADQAVTLRTSFEKLLGQHVVASVRLTRARLRGDADLAQAANDALVKNTDELSALVGSVYGQPAASAFGLLWTKQGTALFNFARGLGAKDAEVMAGAQRDLADYTQNIASYLQTTTGGAVPAAVLMPAVSKHIDLVTQQASAYAAGDYARSYQLEREDYRNEFGLGKLIAAAIAGQGRPLPPAFDSPVRRLQSALGALLGEHAELVTDTTRAGLNHTPDFAAAGAALNDNTRQLGGAMGSLFGSAGGQRFASLWGDHIDAYVDYINGLSAHDDARKGAAVAKAMAFRAAFADFLATATEGKLSAPALAAAFGMHDGMLIRQVDVFAAKDYATAYQLSYDAYQQMFDLSDQVATALGDTVAARLPTGGPQTGGGAMAAEVGRR